MSNSLPAANPAPHSCALFLGGKEACAPSNPADHQARHLADSLEQAALLACNGKITYANAAAATLLGWRKDDPADTSLQQCLAAHAKAVQNLSASTSKAATPLRRLHQQKDLALPDTAETREAGHDSVAPDRETLILLQAAPPTSAVPPAAISMENFPWPVMRLDLQGRYLEANAALLRLNNPPACPAPGLSLSELGWPVTACHAVEQAISCLRTGPGAKSLTLSWPGSKRERHFQADLFTETDATGMPSSVVLLLRTPDESPPAPDENRLHEAQRACAQAQAAAAARDAFFGWMSHELRSPLNGIQSWTHILETYVSASTTSPLATRAMQGIRNGVAQQLRILEELLDISRVIEGKLPLTRHTFSLQLIVQSAVNSIRPKAKARQLILRFDSRMETGKMESDPCRVQQCISLLLSYAIHASPPREEIRLSLENEKGHARLSVRQAYASDGMQEKADAGAAIASQRPSRQDMDLLLARCLAELLEGELVSETDSTGRQSVHTLTLPLTT